METIRHVNRKDRHATKKNHPVRDGNALRPYKEVERVRGGRKRRGDGSCRDSREEVGLVLESFIRDRFRTKVGGPRPILGRAGRAEWARCGVSRALDSIRDQTPKSRVVSSASISPEV